MKRLVEKVKKLQNISFTIAQGDYDQTLKNILLAQEQLTVDDLIYLEKQYTKLFPLFEKIKKQLKSKSKIEQLIKHFEVEKFSQNQVIFRKGDIGRKMYFVLNGTLLSYSYDQRDLSNQASNCQYLKGDHFGEISLHHRIPRTITVICQSDVILLSINYDVYQCYIHQTVDRIISEQFRFIRNVNLFRNWNDLTYSIVLHNVRQSTIQRNQFIYKEGDKDQQIYIIKQGEVILQKQYFQNGKKIENGLICLSEGQCFGDFEYLEDHSWINDKSKIKQVKRKVDAKSTTQSLIFNISFLTYIRIQEDYHPSTIQTFLHNSKLIIIQRMTQLQQQILEQQKSKEEQDDFEQIEQKPIKLVQKSSNPYLSIMSNIKNSFKKDQSSQQTSNQIEVIAKQFCQKSILMKFDRGHKILLLKKLRDASILPDSKDNFIYQHTVRSSFSRLRMNKINNQDSDSVIKPISMDFQNYFSRAQTPNAFVLENQNRQDRTQSVANKCQINDCHNFRLSNSQSRSVSQLSINRTSLNRKSPIKYKFEIEYERNNSQSPMKESKQEVDFCIFGKQ